MSDLSFSLPSVASTSRLGASRRYALDRLTPRLRRACGQRVRCEVLCRRNLVIVIDSKRRKETFGGHGPGLSCCGLRLSFRGGHHSPAVLAAPQKSMGATSPPLDYTTLIIGQRATMGRYLDTSHASKQRVVACCQSTSCVRILVLNRSNSSMLTGASTRTLQEPPSYRLSAADARISSLRVASS